ncbi:apolipoprotein N-acyltransferase [Rhizobium sp.]|uniref:apolipoprotein N-acyltransferase n=1 Tax=Rhizobium sp. TaxID=391 RepID=UPI0028B1768E
MERLAGKVMLLSGWSRIALAVFAGAIGALALPPFGIFATLFISFTLLVWLIDGSTGNPGGGVVSRLRAAFVIGWLFGFGYFVANLWWLGNALLVDAEEFAWALPLAVFGLPAYLAIFYGLATALARAFWSDGIGRLAALAAAFGVAEWLRSFVLTGFPWNAIGYGAMPVPLMMQSDVVLGIFGVTVLAVFVFAAPALLGTGKGKVLGLAAAVLLAVAHVGFGAWRLNVADEKLAAGDGKKTTIRIVQPMIDQAQKLDDTNRAEIFDEHLRLTAAPLKDGETRPDIVVWPETSVPFILTENPDALARIAEVLEDGQVLVTGAVRSENAGAGVAPRYYNSIYVIDSDGQIISAADKVHLVPYGEYVPYESILASLGITEAIAMPGGFTAASSRSLLTLPGGALLYPLICYEAIFPNEIGADVERTSAILNVTNDGWFGATPGPYQHFQQARLRAVENGMFLIRGANTGISAVVDPFGRVVQGLGYNQKGVIDASIGGKYILYWSNRSRQWYFWLVVGFMSVIAVSSRLSFNSREN